MEHCDIRGRWRFDRPEESGVNRVFEGFVEREAVRIASRILTSSFLATISAALPLGARMKGTRPEGIEYQERETWLYTADQG